MGLVPDPGSSPWGDGDASEVQLSGVPLWTQDAPSYAGLGWSALQDPVWLWPWGSSDRPQETSLSPVGLSAESWASGGLGGLC